MDPGGIPGTGIMRDAPFMLWAIMNFFGLLLVPLIDYFFPNGFIRSAKQSAKHVLFAMFDQETLGIHPKAVTLDGRKKRPTSAESRDSEKWEQLWENSVKMVGLKDGDTMLTNWK